MHFTRGCLPDPANLNSPRATSSHAANARHLGRGSCYEPSKNVQAHLFSVRQTDIAQTPPHFDPDARVPDGNPSLIVTGVGRHQGMRWSVRTEVFDQVRAAAR